MFGRLDGKRAGRLALKVGRLCHRKLKLNKLKLCHYEERHFTNKIIEMTTRRSNPQQEGQNPTIAKSEESNKTSKRQKPNLFEERK